MSYAVCSARVITGAGRGKSLGTPTINLDLRDVPDTWKDGIYAGWAWLESAWLPAAIHIGPRPVFHDSRSVEAHILDTQIDTVPARIHLAIHTRLRPVLFFDSTEELLRQIEEDVHRCHGILARYDPPKPPEETHR